MDNPPENLLSSAIRKISRGCRRCLTGFGPGVITGASDDDPSGILTYLQSGVVLGVQALWTVLLTLPLMYGIQEMCGRIGFVTKKGLVRLVKENYSRAVLLPIALISVVVITINIGADLLAVGVVLEKLIPLPRLLWLPLVAAFILIFTVVLSYKKFSRALLVLTLSLFCYVIAAFYLKVDWSAALRATLFPSLQWSKETILLIAAILGTTISPYLFFWQTSEEVEEEQEHPPASITIMKHELKALDEDTRVGMFFSNAVMWFIIAGAGQLGALYGITHIASFDQAALVLQPALGPFAYVMFSLGIIGTGLLAIPVLAGSVGYILSEVFNWSEGMNKKFHHARGFYLSIIGATIAGMFLTLFGFDPVTLLIYTALFYAIITPPLIYLILSIGNSTRIMGNERNTRLSNVLGWATFAVMTLAVAAYLVSLVS